MTWMALEPREGRDRRTRFMRNGTIVKQNVRGWKGRIGCKIDGVWTPTEDACINHVHNKRGAARECAEREARARNRHKVD